LDCGGLTPLLVNKESAVKPAHSKALRAAGRRKNMLNLAPFWTDLEGLTFEGIVFQHSITFSHIDCRFSISYIKL
jgi:hypothetical protein